MFRRLWLMAGVCGLTSGLRAADTVLFALGKPDGSCAEFGLVDETWPQYAARYPKPVDITVGKSPETHWPYIHPSTRDTWAGGKPHTFTLRFDVAQPPTAPVFLHLGVLAVWEPSRLTIALNDQPVAAQRLPDTGGGADLAFHPQNPAECLPLNFAVPPGALRAGANVLTINLTDGSWIIYDYVQLDTSAQPPKIGSALPSDLVTAALDGPMAQVKEVVFAARKVVGEHWYANFAYYAADASRKLYRPGARLCRLDLRTRRATTILDDPEGGIRDPQVSYDGRKVLFSYRKGASEHYNLYEINLDGTGLKALTSGGWDDIEPSYLPDGSIVFVSSRCKRWVNCWLTQVAVLYRCNADGSHLRPLSSNNEHDNTPWPLPDGRILYTRWEYVDRSQVHYHHLWVVNPDGTSQMVYYGNQRPGMVFIDAKPIPGSRKVVASFSPGHGQTEHEGAVGIIDPAAGPDAARSARALTAAHNYRDPWAFSENCIVAAQGSALMLVNDRGKTAELFRLSAEDQRAGYWLHEPRPVIARGGEARIPDRTTQSERAGRLYVADVHTGRNMAGVKPGEIKKLLVLESLPKPINFTGGMEPLSYGGTFTLERVLGTVPVEPDGSAYFEAPAMRSLIFVALDADDLAVKRMQSFVTLMPGETTGCVGCHERRVQTPSTRASGSLTMAMRRAPDAITPVRDVPDVYDFPRDIQPILDRHCVGCHNPDKRSGGVILTGDRGPMLSLSYFMLTARDQVSDGRNRATSNYAPRRLGSAASPLLGKLTPAHHNVRASDRERTMVRLWIETGAPYPGTYAALGCGMIGGYAQNNLDRSDLQWPATKTGGEALQRRCGGCHTGDKRLPLSASDHLGRNPWEGMAPNDPRRRWSRHVLYNLTRPEKSVLLLAPLSKEAGGYGACRETVFRETSDPDYTKVLAMIVAAKARLDEIKRFDMPGFQPREAWVREMKRYGVLPATQTAQTPVDYYATERRYWESLWWTGGGSG